MAITSSGPITWRIDTGGADSSMWPTVTTPAGQRPTAQQMQSVFANNAATTPNIPSGATAAGGSDYMTQIMNMLQPTTTTSPTDYLAQAEKAMAPSIKAQTDVLNQQKDLIPQIYGQAQQLVGQQKMAASGAERVANAVAGFKGTSGTEESAQANIAQKFGQQITSLTTQESSALLDVASKLADVQGEGEKTALTYAAQMSKAMADAFYQQGNLAEAIRHDRATEQFNALKEGYTYDTSGNLTPIGGTGSLTPNDYADQFMSGYMDWSQVPSGLKTQVTSIVKSRGGSVQKIIDAYTGVDNSIANIEKIRDTWNSLSEQEKRIPNALVAAVPALSPKRAGITALFYTAVEGELRKAMVGGRVTQQEINWIRNAIIPGPLDNYDSAMQKLDAVLFGLEQKQTNPSYVLGDNTFQEAQYSGQAGAGSAGGAGEWEVVSP